MGKDIVKNGSSLRKSNIELLRIIAMIMIVAHHVAVHSPFSFSSEVVSVNRLWVQLIQLGGKVGVDIFVLISGYFLVKANSVKMNKVILLWLQIFTYSVGIFFIFLAFFPNLFGIKALIKSVLPVTYSTWWFASAYFVLYLLSPYINKLLNHFEKKEYQRFLLLLMFCWCVVPTFLGVAWQSNSLLWFIFLYALSGYIRIHVDVANIKSKYCFLTSFSLAALTFLSAVVFDVLGTKITFFASNATFFYDMHKLPILLISVSMFIGFLNIDIGSIPLINLISSATFGIYLIHDNTYVRPFLWENVFKIATYQNKGIFVLYTVLVIFLVFIACLFIELFRKYIVEKLYSKAVDSVSACFEKILDKFFSCKLFHLF